MVRTVEVVGVNKCFCVYSMDAAGGDVNFVIDIDADDEALADGGGADAALAGAGGAAGVDALGAADPKRRRSVAA